MAINTKTSTKRRGKQPRPCGGANEGETVEINLYGAGGWPLIDHNINTIVLHGRIEVLLYYGRETVYLVDEKDIVRLKAGEQSCQVAGLVKYRSGSNLEPYAQFVGDDVAQCRLTQARRAKQQHMVEALATQLGCLDKDTKVAHHLALACKVGKTKRTQGVVLLLLGHLLAYIKLAHGVCNL